MRSVNPAFAAALTGAREKGIVPRKFFRATVRDRSTGNPVEIGYWNGDDTVTTDVISAETGQPMTRTYIGGVDLQVGSIPRVSDLTVQTLEVSLGAVPAAVQDMVRGHDARLAKVEIHTGVLDPDSFLPAAPSPRATGPCGSPAFRQATRSRGATCSPSITPIRRGARCTGSTRR